MPDETFRSTKPDIILHVIRHYCVGDQIRFHVIDDEGNIISKRDVVITKIDLALIEFKLV